VGCCFTHLVLCASLKNPDPVVRSNCRAHVVLFYLSAVEYMTQGLEFATVLCAKNHFDLNCTCVTYHAL
jgi:hypothetical protein